MKHTIVFLVLALFLGLEGCNKNKDLIVGCWSTIENYSQQQAANTFHFNDDNTWTYSAITGPFGQTGNEGTYKIRRNKLYLEDETTTTEYKIKKLTEDEMIWEGSSLALYKGSLALYKCD